MGTVLVYLLGNHSASFMVQLSVPRQQNITIIPSLHPLLVLFVLIVLGIVQYVLFTTLMTMKVSMIYGILMLSFSFLSFVNIVLVSVLLQKARILPPSLIAQDSNLHGMWLVGLVSLVSFFIFLCWKIPQLPNKIPLYFNTTQNGLQEVAPETLLLYPFLLVGLFGINILLSNAIHKTNKLASYSIALTSVVLIGILAMIVYSMLLTSHLL